jgi:hypothetical protein
MENGVVTREKVRMPNVIRVALALEIFTSACVVTAAAATAWVWRVPEAYRYFASWIDFMDPTIPLKKWAAPSPQPALREVYYSFGFICYILPAIFLTLRFCFPFRGRMAKKFSVKKRLFSPLLFAFVGIVSFGIAVSPMTDTRGLQIASSNVQLILFGWVDPCVCSIMFWIAIVGLWKSLSGR